MSLTLYQHPLASFCHKVLIALYENHTPFEARLVDLMDEKESAKLAAMWPVGKIPVLHDGAAVRYVAETSIIIEYLDRVYPGPVKLLPADPEQQLEVRLWDRFYDLYISVPMQKIVVDRIRPEGSYDPHGVAEAREMLDVAYGMIETQLAGKTWAIGEAFTMADCAAAPGLFFAGIVHPFPESHVNLKAYFERLLQRPSFARALEEAKPYFQYFPYVADMPRRFLAAEPV
jgi:glutathione S-transferase